MVLVVALSLVLMPCLVHFCCVFTSAAGTGGLTLRECTSLNLCHAKGSGKILVAPSNNFCHMQLMPPANFTIGTTLEVNRRFGRVCRSLRRCPQVSLPSLCQETTGSGIKVATSTTTISVTTWVGHRRTRAIASSTNILQIQQLNSYELQPKKIRNSFSV